jgi:hypothetical protein
LSGGQVSAFLAAALAGAAQRTPNYLTHHNACSHVLDELHLGVVLARCAPKATRYVPPRC